jgi:hypothetical protein
MNDDRKVYLDEPDQVYPGGQESRIRVFVIGYADSVSVGSGSQGCFPSSASADIGRAKRIHDALGHWIQDHDEDTGVSPVTIQAAGQTWFKCDRGGAGHWHMAEAGGRCLSLQGVIEMHTDWVWLQARAEVGQGPGGVDD